MAGGVISWNTMRRTGHLRLERLHEVPRDGLALAVLVGREVELVGVLDERLELADLLLAVGADDVERLEVVVGVDAEARPGLALVLGRDVGGVARQVADVADRGLDDVAVAEVAADRLRLGRRLDDDELGATARLVGRYGSPRLLRFRFGRCPIRTSSADGTSHP